MPLVAVAVLIQVGPVIKVKEKRDLLLNQVQEVKEIVMVMEVQMETEELWV